MEGSNELAGLVNKAALADIGENFVITRPTFISELVYGGHVLVCNKDDP